jgi:hypothetical protein
MLSMNGFGASKTFYLDAHGVGSHPHPARWIGEEGVGMGGRPMGG